VRAVKKKPAASVKKKPAPAAKKKKKPAPAAAKKPTRLLPRAQRPPAAVTRDLFLVWRAPRLGARNPHELTNPVWSWIAGLRETSAWSVNEHFAGPSSLAVGPCFCGTRFGQTRTELADGSVLWIGGEHEDYYDPDFFIYNDVIVEQPDGTRRVFGYPHAVFPPTDSHSATLAGGRVVIVGGLGYPADRIAGTTPVYVLDLATLAITRQPTEGPAPGWLYKHSAALSDDGRSLLIRGGTVSERADGQELHRENIDDWSLDLERWTWTRLTDRRWPQWELRRADGKHNQLFDLLGIQSFWNASNEWSREHLAGLLRDFGREPDLHAYSLRYRPSLAHELVPEEESSYPVVAQVVIDGVTVRFVEDSRSVTLTVEGALPPASVDALVQELRAKLEHLEQTPYVARSLR
jgi:hypothetical protein